jgi:hypothetical protein
MNKFIGWAFVLSVGIAGWAQAGEMDQVNGVALGRLDALTYFTPEQQLIYGDPQRAFDYKGAKFYFITNAHLDAFKADPERFAPQFGGYCAYGAGQGHRSAANPRVFVIQNGRLYLFADRQSLRRWKEDAPANIAKAERAWPSLAGL